MMCIHVLCVKTIYIYVLYMIYMYMYMYKLYRG